MAASSTRVPKSARSEAPSARAEPSGPDSPGGLSKLSPAYLRFRSRPIVMPTSTLTPAVMPIDCQGFSWT